MTAIRTKTAVSCRARVAAEIRRFAKDPLGVTSIEYAVFAALIAGVVFSSISLLGDELAGLYQKFAELALSFGS